MKWSSDKCDYVTFCRFLRRAAQIPYQASWSEEKDWKPDWQRIPGAGQEQPSNIQLLGLVKCAILTQQMSMYMTNGMKVRLLFWDSESLIPSSDFIVQFGLIRIKFTAFGEHDLMQSPISFYGWGMGRGFTATYRARLGPILAITSLSVAACSMSHQRHTQVSLSSPLSMNIRSWNLSPSMVPWPSSWPAHLF